MTDLEKELVEKLAKAWVGTEQNPWDLVSEEQRKSWEALCIEGYLPLIRSHTQTLVAAAYARATNLIAQVRDDYHSNDGPFDMGMRLQMLENEVCSLTPADAARELERRELGAERNGILRVGSALNAGEKNLGKWIYNAVYDIEDRLSKPAPVERSNAHD